MVSYNRLQAVDAMIVDLAAEDRFKVDDVIGMVSAQTGMDQDSVRDRIVDAQKRYKIFVSQDDDAIVSFNNIYRHAERMVGILAHTDKYNSKAIAGIVNNAIGMDVSIIEKIIDELIAKEEIGTHLRNGEHIVYELESDRMSGHGGL